MNCSMPGLPVHHELPEFTQTHVHWVGDAIQHNPLYPCCPLLLLPSIFASIRVFSNESVLCIRWPKYWSFSFSISPSNEHPGSSAGEESSCNVGDLSLIPGLGTSPGEQLSTSVFWPGEFHEMYSTWGYEELDRTEWLSLFSETLRKYVVKLVARLLTFVLKKLSGLRTPDPLSSIILGSVASPSLEFSESFL